MERIAYIISMPHGVDRWTHSEIEALREEGVAVSVFPVRYNSGPYMPEAHWDLYRFRRQTVMARQPLWLLKDRGTYVKLLSEARRTKTLVDFWLGFDFAQQMARRHIDRIHCVFGDHKLFIGYYCKKILGVPLSVALYGYELRANPNWEMFSRAIAACDDIIVNCEFNRQLLIEHAGQAAGQRARVIHHYAEIAPPSPSDRLKVLIVGGFQERKGHDLLFKAVKKLGPEANRVEVWVAGYAGSVDMPKLARDLGVSDQVKILGAVPDSVIDLLYDQCDIFCLPSKTDKSGVNEGLPVALIEAMAHGKPVIATRMSGIPELVEEFLIEENNVDEIAAAIQLLMNDPERRRAAGERNRAIVQAQYSKQNLFILRDLFRGTTAVQS